MQFYRNHGWKYPEGDPTSSYNVIPCFAEQALQTQHAILFFP